MIGGGRRGRERSITHILAAALRPGSTAALPSCQALEWLETASFSSGGKTAFASLARRIWMEPRELPRRSVALKTICVEMPGAPCARHGRHRWTEWPRVRGAAPSLAPSRAAPRCEKGRLRAYDVGCPSNVTLTYRTCRNFSFLIQARAQFKEQVPKTKAIRERNERTSPFGPATVPLARTHPAGHQVRRVTVSFCSPGSGCAVPRVQDGSRLWLRIVSHVE